MRTTKILFLSVLMIISGLVILTAQTNPVVIQNIEVNSKGLTGRIPVLLETEMEPGVSFDSLESLEKYLEEKRQILDNTRLFEEIEITYEIAEKTQDSTFVLVTIRLKESWNMIVLPYPEYDNNTGLSLSLRFRDYNFLGSMEPLSLNLNYIVYDNDEKKTEYSADASYAYNFKLGPQPFTLTFAQSVNLYQYEKSADNQVPYYLSTGIDLGTSFQTPILLFDRDALNYTIGLGIGTNYSHEGFRFPDDEDLEKFNVDLEHGFEVKRINWTDNYRNGYHLSIKQKYFYNFITEVADVRSKLQIAYHTGSYPLQFSSRLVGSIYGFTTTDLGDEIRGVMDSSIEGMGGVFLNTNLMLTLLRLPPIAELQAGLLADFGYAFGFTDSSNYRSPLYTGIGIEAIAFPYFSKRLYVRVSLAFNVEEVWKDRSLAGDGHYEIFIGLGHFF